MWTWCYARLQWRQPPSPLWRLLRMEKRSLLKHQPQSEPPTSPSLLGRSSMRPLWMGVPARYTKYGHEYITKCTSSLLGLHMDTHTYITKHTNDMGGSCVDYINLFNLAFHHIWTDSTASPLPWSLKTYHATLHSFTHFTILFNFPSSLRSPYLPFATLCPSLILPATLSNFP